MKVSSDARARSASWRARHVLVLCVALAGACTSSGGIERHPDGEGGPLSATTGSGSSSLFAPGNTPWYGSFGSHLLCTRVPGKKLTLREVTYEAEVEPLEVTPYLRTVRPDQVQGDDNRQATIGTAVGKPPNLDGGEPVPGTFTTEIAGHEISDSCEPDFDSGYTELIIVMKSDERGGYLPGVSIRYTTEGGEYILHTDRGMISCGSDILMVDGEDACASIESSALR